MTDFHEILMLATALLVSLMATPLGCLVIWRRMAYFGDALSHTALLGIALGLLVGGSAHLGAVFVCSVFALSMIWMENRYKLSTDTLLGILAHGGLAFGILTLSLLQPEQPASDAGGENHAHVNLHDYEQYFFGDLSLTSGGTVLMLAFGAVVILGLLKRYWAELILMILSEDLAKAEGHNTMKLKYVLLLSLTVTVALSVQTVGILFTTSLLILPAAAARQLAATPRHTVVYAYIAALAAVAAGFPTAHNMHLPYGPVIAAYMSLLFVVSLVLSGLIRKKPPRI